jgi:nicotinate-nucleotide adenylyltransferase
VRLGLFGGSFDPPHVGHLLVAGDAHEALRLDRVVFIPTGVQPLKVGRAVATPLQRLEMVRMLIANDPRFDVDAVEIERPGLSFTVDTLSEYADRYRGAELFLLVGADVPGAFARWREPERIVQLATVVVLNRAEDADGWGDKESEEGPGATQLRKRLTFLPTRRIDISSTEIRARLRSGKPVRGFVPDSVAEFIATERLYC